MKKEDLTDAHLQQISKFIGMVVQMRYCQRIAWMKSKFEPDKAEWEKKAIEAGKHVDKFLLESNILDLQGFAGRP